jgi:hypothetical protein
VEKMLPFFIGKRGRRPLSALIDALHFSAGEHPVPCADFRDFDVDELGAAANVTLIELSSE